MFWPRSGIHAHATAADVAGEHGEVGHAHDHGGALGVLGDAEAVIDRAIAARGIEPGRARESAAGSTPVTRPSTSGELRSVADEVVPELEVDGIAALGDEGLVLEALGDNDMGERIDDGDIGAGQQLQMKGGLDMR